MLRPRRAATRSRSCPTGLVLGSSCTDSTAAQRTSREPCLVIRPRCTLVSDSWCLGVSPAQQASCSAPQLACWAGLTPKHHESDTKVHRGRITKQGSRLVRWAAVESVQLLPKTSPVGQLRDRVAARRGRNIGVVAAARRQIEYVYYALRDHHVRALHPIPVAAT